MIKDPTTHLGYGYHDYLMALHYLIDTNQIQEEVVVVPKEGERPEHTFVFFQFEDNPNDVWNKEVVNKFIAEFAKAK
jgi:hypothetical protein